MMPSQDGGMKRGWRNEKRLKGEKYEKRGMKKNKEEHETKLKAFILFTANS